MTRKEAREWLIKTVYQQDFHRKEGFSFFESSMRELTDKAQAEYIQNVLSSVFNKEVLINQKIEGSSINWALARIPKIDLAIMKVAVAEILFLKDIPQAASVNEAVELAKIYGATEKSPDFINAVLKKITKNE